jgi:sortase A
VPENLRAKFNRVVTRAISFKWNRDWPALFILVGVALLLYVGSEYATTYFEQRRLAREWQQQQRLEEQVATSNSDAAIVDDGLTRISIPKINLDAIVVDGTSYKKLKLGPGRILNTALPGTVGNSVITAHRDTFFRHIYELKKGDEIVVQRSGKKFRYEVTGKKVVDPSDLSVTKQSKDKRLTLITCYPTYYIGPAPERLVVFSKMADEQESTQPPAVAASGGAH